MAISSQGNSKAVVLGTFANNYDITIAILENSRAVDLKKKKQQGCSLLVTNTLPV